MNIEVSDETLAELENAFKFNDAVIRKLVLRTEEAVSEQSPLFKVPDEEKKPGEYRSRGNDSDADADADSSDDRSEEHTSELQSLMRISYAVFCLKNKKINTT